MISKIFGGKSKPIIYLHIGTNKTGTTSIQKYFADNYAYFRKHGLLYPQTAMVGSAHYELSASLGFCHDPVGNEWVKSLPELKRGLEKELSREQLSSVVISSEDFMLNRDAKKVQAFFEGYQVKVIVYLRRHDTWWESAYSQAVKMIESPNPPWGMGIKEFISFHEKKNKYIGNYKKLLDKWEKVFGRENIIVRPFERQQNKPDIIHDILSAIGYEPDEQGVPEFVQKENMSLSAKSIQLLDVYKRVAVDEEVRKRLVDYALSLPADTKKIRLMPLNMQLRQIIKNTPKYEYIAKKFMGRDDGMLFYDPLPQEGPDAKSPPVISLNEIVEETVKALGSS